MKITALLKTTCFVLLVLGTTELVAQNEINKIEPLPRDSEKFNLILPKIYWLNKSKITIENYGVAKIKEGITSTESNRKKGITYSETKQKISIALTNPDNESSYLHVSNSQKDEYVIKDNFILNRVLDLGMESEEIEGMVFYPKIIKGTITVENSAKFELEVLIINQENFLNIEIGKITDGERTITVIRTNLDSNRNLNAISEISLGTLFYEFLENGISLGAVTYDVENSIWLKPGLDSLTKLILCTAMLSIAY